jgi:hypothetical protein
MSFMNFGPNRLALALAVALAAVVVGFLSALLWVTA